MNIHNTLTIAPIQKARITADIAENIPSIHPIPNTSLASPSPIQLPFENNHNRKNGKAMIGPANIDERDGRIKVNSGEMNNFTNAIAEKEYDNVSGMTLCLISYTVMTMSIDVMNR